eukprot:scaffold4448_cov115-Isochrysis_galbana.AAC.8
MAGVTVYFSVTYIVSRVVSVTDHHSPPQTSTTYDHSSRPSRVFNGLLSIGPLSLAPPIGVMYDSAPCQGDERHDHVCF